MLLTVSVWEKKLQLSRLDSTSLNVDSDLINNINVLDLDNVSVQDSISHKPLPGSGRASVEYIMKGIDLAMGWRNRCDCNSPHK